MPENNWLFHCSKCGKDLPGTVFAKNHTPTEGDAQLALSNFEDGPGYDNKDPRFVIIGKRLPLPIQACEENSYSQHYITEIKAML